MDLKIIYLHFHVLDSLASSKWSIGDCLIMYPYVKVGRKGNSSKILENRLLSINCLLSWHGKTSCTTFIILSFLSFYSFKAIVNKPFQKVIYDSWCKRNFIIIHSINTWYSSNSHAHWKVRAVIWFSSALYPKNILWKLSTKSL